MDEEIESPLAWSLGTSLRRVADDETFVSDSQILVLQWLVLALRLLYRPIADDRVSKRKKEREETRSQKSCENTKTTGKTRIQRPPQHWRERYRESKQTSPFSPTKHSFGSAGVGL